MKKYSFLLLLFATQALLVFSQSRYEKEPYLVKSLSKESIKMVEAQTSGGSITVTGGNSTDARIEVYISPNNNKSSVTDEELKKRVEELYNLDITVASNKLRAVAKSKENIKDWKKAVSISFKIFVPQNVSTDLSTSGGNITLTSLSGSQEFTTSGGNLIMDKISGKTEGKTSGGNIAIENSKDEIDLSTSGGNIAAKACSGNMKLSTSGGSLELKNLSGDIEAKTSGGNIDGKDISGELTAHTSGGNVQLLNLNASVDASTSGGNILLAVTKLGKYVKLQNSGGSVALTVPKNSGLDLDLSGRMKGTNFENFSGKIEDNKVRGKLNGGGVPVKIDAGDGRISLELK
jgi:hypothetical protein